MRASTEGESEGSERKGLPSFATYKAERGVSPYQLQRWLGHRNLNTTQIYVHLGKQNSRKVMEFTSL